MATKRLRTHHEDDTMSICSTDSSRTLDFSDSEPESETITPLVTPKASRLLSLPIELRFLIYQYAFSAPSTPSPPLSSLIQITIDRGHPSPRETKYKPLKYTRTPTTTLPAFFLTINRQIYNEALPILFSSVVFSFASNPTSLTFLLDRFSDLALRCVRYLRLYPAPLYTLNNEPLGERLSWTVLCAQVAKLPSLRKVVVVYRCPGDLMATSVEAQRVRYGKALSLIAVAKEMVFDEGDTSSDSHEYDMEECRRRFEAITAALTTSPAPAPAQIAEF
ncbi:uncharacterized protein BDV14DRAFT_199369 [Aspergillus stella-maris]|uniref:uncharacterized protein n=1 Tax=Aspergillus stella-maris TaxID=1810926 RepID=UPI003CCDF87A